MHDDYYSYSTDDQPDQYDEEGAASLKEPSSDQQENG